MSNETSRSSRTGSIRRAARIGIRLLLDLTVVSLWVLLLTLLFLATGWSGWTFYAVLLVGVGIYVAFTAGWR